MELKPVQLFNNFVESGLRTLIILTSCFPNKVDIDKLVYLDYFLVHSGDYSKDFPSLHASFSARGGEIFVRRGLIIDGLNFLKENGLIIEHFGGNGILYSASEDSSPFLDCLGEEYTTSLMNISENLIIDLSRLDISELKNKIPQFSNINYLRYEQ